MVREEDKDRRVRQEVYNLPRIVVNDVGEEEVTEDDKGQSEDLHDKLMEMTGGSSQTTRMTMTLT